MKLFNFNKLRESNLEQIRLQLVYSILFVLVALGLPTIIIASIEAYMLQQFSTVLIYLIFFTPIMIVTIFRKRLNYKLIASTVILFGLLLALSNIIVYGFGGGGIPILFSVFALTTIFFNRRAGLFLILLSAILMCIIGYLYITHQITLSVSLDAISTETISWLTALIVMVFLGALIVLSFGILQSKMMQSIQHANENTEKLNEVNLLLTKDIQSRIITEKKLQRSEKLLIDAQHIAKLGNWEYISLASEIKISKACYAILELDEDIPASQILEHIKDRTSKKDLIEYNRIIKSAFQNGDNFNIDFKYVFQNESKSIKCTGKPNKDVSGDIVGFQGIIHDVTEYKQNEITITELNAELENKIKTRTHEIDTKNKDLADIQGALLNIVEDLNEKSNQLENNATILKRTNKELEAFSYSVSHDLRAPLRGINGFTQILMEEYSEKMDPEFKRISTIISENSHKMGQLIDDLLAFSRLSRSELRNSVINMEGMVNSIYYEVTDEEQRKRIEISFENLGLASGDPAMIKQVWTNLLSNAIKFSSKKKKSIISVTSAKNKDKYVYCISDNGAGFDMKYIDKLFGVFQRLHSPKKFEGTGVGLANVQRIIARHDGEVWAESEIDHGARFYFSLPIIQ